MVTILLVSIKEEMIYDRIVVRIQDEGFLERLEMKS